MKVNLISAVLLFALAGCGKDKQSTDELVTINVSKDYPEKELILQDIMDVEYIALETTDEFITHGNVMDIGEKFIIVKNNTNDGNIFIFDRKTGKAIRKINRLGQGVEEYPGIAGITLDEIKRSLCLDEIMFLLERKIDYKIAERFVERCFSLVIYCLLAVYDVMKKDCRTQSGIHNKQ